LKIETAEIYYDALILDEEIARSPQRFSLLIKPRPHPAHDHLSSNAMDVVPGAVEKPSPLTSAHRISPNWLSMPPVAKRLDLANFIVDEFKDFDPRAPQFARRDKSGGALQRRRPSALRS
jgi:hypothetical protein